MRVKSDAPTDETVDDARGVIATIEAHAIAIKIHQATDDALPATVATNVADLRMELHESTISKAPRKIAVAEGIDRDSKIVPAEAIALAHGPDRRFSRRSQH